MREVSAKEAREMPSSLLKSVEAGEEVVILRRGKKVARLVPPSGSGARLPTLRKFRASVRIKGSGDMDYSGLPLHSCWCVGPTLWQLAGRDTRLHSQECTASISSGT